MSADQETNKVTEPSREQAVYRMCRIGTLLWKLPVSVSVSRTADRRRNKQGLVDAVCGALNKDTRVTEVKRPTISSEYSTYDEFYPDLNRTDNEALLKGNDLFEVLCLSKPIYFSVHVPKKNQPALHDEHDIRSEDYFVAWDGVTALVLWEQDDDFLPLAGGQIVAEILDSALQKIKTELYNQACSPDCQNIFFHTSMHVYDISETDADENGLTFLLSDDSDERSVDVFVPTHDGNFDILEWIYLDVGLPAERFADLKSIGRRVLDIEESIREQFIHLLSHYHEHASIAARPLWSSLRARWRIRRWRKEARYLVAGLWLSLANVEALRRRWEERRRGFESDIAESEIRPLFAKDYTNDAATVDSLEIEHLDSMINQMSSSLDNRAIMVATVGGALAGGLAGALIGLIH